MKKEVEYALILKIGFDKSKILTSFPEVIVP